MGIAALGRTLMATAAAVTVGACAHQPELQSAAPSDLKIGRHLIRTLPLDPGIAPISATYTPSGKVLVAYRSPGSTDRRELNLAVVDDNGRNLRTFFSQRLPDRPKDNGIRYMVFQDNQRVFLGDFILECAPSLDDCDTNTLLPVEYPREVASGDHISHRWSEMIVAPDNRHVSWTTLLSNYSAIVFNGVLERGEAGYVIANPQIVSTLDPFLPDPHHADGVIPQTVRGGEVKQFVHGGAALSLAGAVRRDIPDSVVQHLATGQVEAITDTPGYTETTIFSPDERLGITMSSRFSPADPAILGLVPRPYPASLNMGLSMFAYTYAVTGVRSSRPGNVGPALIDIAASKSRENYLGVNLNTQEEWVFRSPISWHPSSKKGMWMEALRGGSARRIQIVELPDYHPAAAVTAKPTPDAIPYATSDMSLVRAYAAKSQNIDVKVYGRASGHILYRRTPAGIEKTYVNFSDDGRDTYTGREATRSDPRGNSTYTADLRLSGSNSGAMNLTITFGPLAGERPARLVFDRNAAGVPMSRGYAEYNGRRLTVDQLAP